MNPACGKRTYAVEVSNLRKHFRVRPARFGGPARSVHAVSDVSFELSTGGALGIVGESGSGKSVTLRALMQLHPPAKTRLSGAIEVDGRNLLSLSPAELRRYRGGTAAMIFQDPALALDPVYTVGHQIEEALRWHAGLGKREARARAVELLDMVKIPSPAERLANYPHEMSGGMRQRVMIALALSGSPKLILADEPTTALDATVQIQVLLILRQLQRQLGTSAVFVTHDLGVAAQVCDRIAVMYAGRIVEIGSAEDLLARPRHPYTQALLASTIHGDRHGQRIEGITGSPPDLAHLPPGCAFHERCSRAMAQCTQQIPALRAVNTDGASACWLHEA